MIWRISGIYVSVHGSLSYNYYFKTTQCTNQIQNIFKIVATLENRSSIFGRKVFRIRWKKHIIFKLLVKLYPPVCRKSIRNILLQNWKSRFLNLYLYYMIYMIIPQRLSEYAASVFVVCQSGNMAKMYFRAFNYRTLFNLLKQKLFHQIDCVFKTLKRYFLVFSFYNNFL